MYTSSGEAHGLIGVLTNSVEFNDFKHMDPKTKEKCIKDKKEDDRLVKVKYINARGSQERLEKAYCRWAGAPIQQWKLIPGYVYEVPMGLVNEINENRPPKRSGLMSIDGKDIRKDGSPLDQDVEAEPLHLIVPANF